MSNDQVCNLDKLVRAREILMGDFDPEYPIYCHYEGIMYRIDSKDAEPVEVVNDPDQ